jgi:hypothetical protein
MFCVDVLRKALDKEVFEKIEELINIKDIIE